MNQHYPFESEREAKRREAYKCKIWGPYIAVGGAISCFFSCGLGLSIAIAGVASSIYGAIQVKALEAAGADGPEDFISKHKFDSEFKQPME